MYINNVKFNALIDSGISENWVHPAVVHKLGLVKQSTDTVVSMASASFTNSIAFCTVADVKIRGKLYNSVKINLLENLCTDIILGLSFQKLHKSVTFSFNGPEPPLEVCGLAALKVDPPDLFSNLTPNCKPIATKSRKYNVPDKQFIKSETQRLLSEGVIEPSKSPWHAQVVVAKDDYHKKRLVIDYSETINKYTQLDAYPLPNIDEFVNDIAKFKVFSSIDLKSAYHQIPLKHNDKAYTAFEADGGLYQFCRMPFGITNGVSSFQRVMNQFINSEGLLGTFAYLDNIFVCGDTQEEHDANLKAFLAAAKRNNWTFNNDKCIFSTQKLFILGSVVENGIIRPDPNRLKPLRDLPIPYNAKLLKRTIGLFSHYSKYIPKFSDKIAPLVRAKNFPLSQEAVVAFENLKVTIENSVVQGVDESLPFEIETDASDIAIAAVLSQNNRPVAFFSRTLQGSERKWASVEKEACAVIESVRSWKHYLTGRRFKLVTDQKSVSYIFDSEHKGKVKNEKLYRWRLELSCYHFDIKYRPGKENIAADTFSRVYCLALSTDYLYQLHCSLCHPGITRMTAHVRSRNLPFSVEDIRNMVSGCRICRECKPRFYRPIPSTLIKATQPMERLNLDFKGPLPSCTQNKFMLTIVDEFTRYPFAVPCKDLTAVTVNKALCSIFSLFGTSAYVHSDRGSAFMSRELKSYLHAKGVVTSRTTPYNPQGNGLVERYNGTIWKAVTLALKTRNLPTSRWEEVLPDALHSIRSLISTSTNATPHERMFNFQRRTSSGMSLPSWLTIPGPVLLKRHVRPSKYDPLVDEVELIEANPNYAHIKHLDGTESTVSLRDLAPTGNDISVDPVNPVVDTVNTDDSVSSEPVVPPDADVSETAVETAPLLRRSLRQHKPPVRFIP